MAQIAQIFSFFDKRRGESHTDYIDLSCVAREIDFIFSQITQIFFDNLADGITYDRGQVHVNDMTGDRFEVL